MASSKKRRINGSDDVCVEKNLEKKQNFINVEAIRAGSVRSGRVVVLGLDHKVQVNCAGMAYLRVFQGHVDILGFEPSLGTYYPIYSPKWDPLLALTAKESENTQEKNNETIQLNADYQAFFGESSMNYIKLKYPRLAASIEMDDETAADAIAKEIAEDFPIVLVFHAMQVSYGNVHCYYEASNNEIILPGFKMIITKEQRDQLLSKLKVRTELDSNSSSSKTATVLHDLKDPRHVLLELFVSENFKTIVINDQWKITVNFIEKTIRENPKRILVCGAKGVGKSTFCRYLVNRLLVHHRMVAFLDTDSGQPEFTTPGMVSLHIIESPLLGPGFSHLQTPLRGFFCGGVNPSNDPLYYVNAVQSLLRLYQSKAASLPLVINTDGWIKSMGHDLLCSVIQEAQPDHIVQLLATTKNKQFDLPSNGKWMIHALNPWDPNYTSQPNRSSQEMRLYRYHAYFLSGTSCEINRQQLQNLHLTSEKNRLNSYIHQAYTKLKPFTLHFDQVDIAFAGSSVPSCQLLVSLNACLVGLCINPRKKSPPTSQGLRILSQIPHGPCLGVGFIRGIDPNRKLLYLLSPLEEEKISLINLIVRSAPNLKSVATLLLDTEENVQTPYVVDHLLPPEGTGAGEMKSRNSIKRRRDENNYNTPTK